jgi:hypothetical protein
LEASLEAAAQEMGVEVVRAATAYSQAGAMAPVSADWVDDSAPEMVCQAAWAVCPVDLVACSAG